MENKEGDRLTPITPNASGAPFSPGAELDTPQSLVLKGGGSNSILRGSQGSGGVPDGRAVEGSQFGPPTPSHPNRGFLSGGEGGSSSARVDPPHGSLGSAPCGSGNPSEPVHPPHGSRGLTEVDVLQWVPPNQGTVVVFNSGTSGDFSGGPQAFTSGGPPPGSEFSGQPHAAPPAIFHGPSPCVPSDALTLSLTYGPVEKNKEEENEKLIEGEKNLIQGQLIPFSQGDPRWAPQSELSDPNFPQSAQPSALMQRRDEIKNSEWSVVVPGAPGVAPDPP